MEADCFSELPPAWRAERRPTRLIADPARRPLLDSSCPIGRRIGTLLRGFQASLGGNQSRAYPERPDRRLHAGLLRRPAQILRPAPDQTPGSHLLVHPAHLLARRVASRVARR